MRKNIFSILIILFLISIIIYKVIDEKSGDHQKDNEFTSGAGIVAKDKEPLKPGTEAPNLNLTNLDGDPVQLEDFRGKKVILNFWATWCLPCKKEMPELQKFHDQYGEEFIVLAVNLTGTENKISNVQDYITEGAYTFTVLLDQNDVVPTTYRTTSIPMTYFISKEGKIALPTKFGEMNEKFLHSLVKDFK